MSRIACYLGKCSTSKLIVVMASASFRLQHSVAMLSIGYPTALFIARHCVVVLAQFHVYPLVFREGACIWIKQAESGAKFDADSKN